MAQSQAYEIGRIIGILTFLAFGVGLMVFFVIALVKAINTRRAGWIVAASLAGFPIVCFLLLMVVAFGMGLSKGLTHANEVAAAKRGEPSALLTAPMTSITGNLSSYEISLPSADDWTKKTGHHPYDYVFSYNDAYLGAIVERIGLGTSEHVCEFAKKNITAKASESSVTEPTPIQIDSHNWLTFDVTATVSGIHIKYRYYVYADANNTVQLISWTSPPLFDRYAPVFDRVAKSFKLQQQ